MRQALLHGNRDVRVETVDLPAVGAGDVRIDVDTCGICGTDLHEYAHGPIFAPVDEPHSLTGATLPVPMGHEFGGVVAETGADVERLERGDRVAIHPILSCKACQYCQAGKYHLCERIGFVGTSGVGGGFADGTVVPAENAVALPDDLALPVGAFVEPLNAAVHALRRSSFAPGDVVGVFGAGPIGLLLLQAARASGAERIYVSEPQSARRELAAGTGASAAFDPSATDVVKAMRDQTDGGVDVAFEVSGTGTGLRQAVRSTKRDGCVTVVSIFDDEVTIQPNDIVSSERTVTGTLGSLAGPRAPRGEFRTAAHWLADGRIDPEPLVTAQIDLDDLVAEGFEALLAEESEHVKVLVEP